MRLYLSGPITGIDSYRENFQNAKRQLAADGYTNIINPAELCQVLPEDHTSWDEYMKISLALLDMADTLILLPGWEKSMGAQRELGYALAKNLIVLEFESMMKR